MSETIVDVLIIGGGIAGAGLAAMLPEELTVVLVERETQCGYHSTGRSAAAWVAGYGGQAIRELTVRSKSYLMNPPSALQESSFLSPRGEMLIACSDAEQHALAIHIDETNHLQPISIAEACRKVPLLNVECLQQAAFTAEAHDIDADRLLQAWIRSAKNQGVQVLMDWSVAEVTRCANHWQVISGSGKTVLADTIVNAAGAWADSVAELAGLSPLGLVPHRRSAALLPASPEWDIRQWPLIISADETWYARPMGSNLMVSPADETPVEPHDAFAEDLTIAQGLNRFEHAININVQRLETTWAGLRTFASDRVPVAGYDARTTGFFWLAGQGGYGIQTAPALSMLAAALLVGEEGDDSTLRLRESVDPSRLIKL